MFSLIYGFVEIMLRKEELHILVIGLDKAGKTSAVERLKTQLTDHAGLDLSRVVPTVGLNVAKFEALGTNLVIWDLGGAPGLRAIWDKYYSDAHAVVFVVDSSAPARLAEARAALERASGSRELAGAPVLVLANKQDAPGAAGAADVAEALGLAGGGGGGGGSGGGGGGSGGAPVVVQAASAATGQGLSDGLKWLIDAVKKGPRRRLVARA